MTTPFQLFDALDPATEAALTESIRRFGVLVPVVRDQAGNIVDGHHRARIADSLGVPYRVDVLTVADDDEAKEIARTLNADRRHLDLEQRRQLVADLRASGHSLRAIGGVVGVSHTEVRRDLAEIGTEVPIPDRVQRRGGGTYPSTRSPAPVEDEGAIDITDLVTDVAHELVAQQPEIHEAALERAVRTGGGEESVWFYESEWVGEEAEAIVHELLAAYPDGNVPDDDIKAAVTECVESKQVPPLPITKPDLGNGVSHPARYSDVLLPIFAELLAGATTVLDPFAGTGRIHELQPEFSTVGVEIEPEWADLHPDTIVGSALSLAFDDWSFDAICTSPTYGNRLADHHNAVDPHLRRSYTHDLGRALHPDNSGGLQWGEEYREFHRRAWKEAARVLRPGGSFVLNIKDHTRAGARQAVSAWHVRELLDLGFVFIDCVGVDTRQLRQGTNTEARWAELVWLLRKP